MGDRDRPRLEQPLRLALATSTTPRRFFAAVREEAEEAGRLSLPQTRDMNPLYTGKDVSFIDTKQANRLAENVLLDAEASPPSPALLGARYPTEAIDKAWRQLLFGAHHDGITGSESDQVYLDLLGGGARRGSWDGPFSTPRSATSGPGSTPPGRGGRWLSSTTLQARTDAGSLRADVELGWLRGSSFAMGTGARRPVRRRFAVDLHADGSLARIVVAFRRRGMFPPSATGSTGAVRWRSVGVRRWTEIAGAADRDEHYQVEVDAARGGA